MYLERIDTDQSIRHSGSLSLALQHSLQHSKHPEKVVFPMTLSWVGYKLQKTVIVMT